MLYLPLTQSGGNSGENFSALRDVLKMPHSFGEIDDVSSAGSSATTVAHFEGGEQEECK